MCALALRVAEIATCSGQVYYTYNTAYSLVYAMRRAQKAYIAFLKYIGLLLIKCISSKKMFGLALCNVLLFGLYKGCVWDKWACLGV